MDKASPSGTASLRIQAGIVGSSPIMVAYFFQQQTSRVQSGTSAGPVWDGEALAAVASGGWDQSSTGRGQAVHAGG